MTLPQILILSGIALLTISAAYLITYYERN